MSGVTAPQFPPRLSDMIVFVNVMSLRALEEKWRACGTIARPSFFAIVVLMGAHPLLL